MKLLNVDTVEEAHRKVKKMIEEIGIEVQTLSLLEALEEVLAEDIFAANPIPSFDRSTVDGYAVRPEETTGASESIPVFLKIVGEVQMGQEAGCRIGQGECAYVPTGGMIPPGAGAVVMVEHCELFSKSEAAVCQAVPQGANIVRIGDDMERGALILRKGTRLRPQEIGALASLGITEVPVFRHLSITIISTGDELIAPDEKLQPGQVRDINTYGLLALAKRFHFEVQGTHVLRDERELLSETVKKDMSGSDIVIISGGSSQGKKDETCAVIDVLASEGVLTHGLALKPGKPSIFGYDRPSRTLLMGLPGHPAAAMLVFELVLVKVWHEITGEKEPVPIRARMSMNVPAAPGKLSCQLVRLKQTDDGEVTAIPVFGRSGLISVLTKADGYVLAAENQEGIRCGELVDVHTL